MLKLISTNIEETTEFCIRNSWRTQIAKLLNKDEECFPFNYKIAIATSHTLVCESVSDGKSKKKYSIIITPIVYRYLNSMEVDDCNVGLYFCDYIPLENTKLLVFDKKNNSIIPVQMKLKVELSNDMPYLDMVLVNLLSNEEYEISSMVKNSWKFLKGSDSYMTDMEKMYQDTFIHKEYVTMVCSKFAKYLCEQGLQEDADKLLERAKVHDNSKIQNKDEFRALSNIVHDRSCLRNANSQLSSFRQDSIELHWKHNAHHPEHYENYDDMSRIDRLEMVCDWMARSLQYGSDLIEFVTVRQTERFHFSELMYDELLHYCKVLVSLFN